MSAICASIARDGAPAESSCLQLLSAPAPHRGPLTDWQLVGPAALGAQNLVGGPSNAVAIGRGGVSIAFHGRVDNGDELLAELRDSDRETAEASPLPRTAGSIASPDRLAALASARIVLDAYARWQHDCAERIIGDFAFVIWDQPRRRVYAARDALGVKPLYYAAGSTRLVAATELGQVIATGMPLEPCESMVAELLAFDVRSRHETLYEGVHRLPPGHWMMATSTDLRVVRYWAPDGTAELSYRRDEDYAAHFRALFGRAVGDRTTGCEVAAYLSGGLDSSSVVCMARALNRQLETFSMVFPTEPAADERSFIEAVTAHLGVPAHVRAVTGIDAAAYRADAVARVDLPDLPGDAIGRPLFQAMRAQGLRVALTGAGGDYGFTGSFFHYADLLQQGDLRGLFRQARADRQTDDVGWSFGALFTCGARLLLPGPLRRVVRPCARAVGWGARVPPWITPALARRSNLLDRMTAPRVTRPGPLHSRNHVCELFESGWTARLLESGDRAAADFGLEPRHPFFDRRLVDFAVSLPEAQRWRGRTTKFVMREAMRELLPESVYARSGKADASAFVPAAVEALGGERALRRLEIADQGWVEPGVLLDEYRQARAQLARHDEAFCSGMFRVWTALAVEAWFRGRFIEDSRHDRYRSAATGRDARGRAIRGDEAEALSTSRAG